MWKESARQMESGSENPRAYARAFLAKRVFFLHFLHQLVYLLVKQGVAGEGKHSLRVEDFERMPDGGEGSEGKKHGICVYDARVGVCEEGEHFPQR